MRGIECTVPNCGHIHANAEQLIDEVVPHAREAHPDMGPNQVAARRLVEPEAYDDSARKGRKHGWAEFVGSLGQSGTPQ